MSILDKIIEKISSPKLSTLRHARRRMNKPAQATSTPTPAKITPANPSDFSLKLKNDGMKMPNMNTAHSTPALPKVMKQIKPIRRGLRSRTLKAAAKK